MYRSGTRCAALPMQWAAQNSRARFSNPVMYETSYWAFSKGSSKLVAAVPLHSSVKSFPTHQAVDKHAVLHRVVLKYVGKRKWCMGVAPMIIVRIPPV